MSTRGAAENDPGEIERQIHETRERLEQALQALSERLQPREVLERAIEGAYDDAGELARGFARHLRRHPLPWALGALNAALVLYVGARAGRARRPVRGGPTARAAPGIASRPWWLGGLGFALGLLFSAAVPSTPTERRMLRATGVQLGRRARQAAAAAGASLRAVRAAAESVRGRGRTDSGGPTVH